VAHLTGRPLHVPAKVSTAACAVSLGWRKEVTPTDPLQLALKAAEGAAIHATVPRGNVGFVDDGSLLLCNRRSHPRRQTTLIAG